MKRYNHLRYFIKGRDGMTEIEATLLGALGAREAA